MVVVVNEQDLSLWRSLTPFGIFRMVKEGGISICYVYAQIIILAQKLIRMYAMTSGLVSSSQMLL